MPLVTLTVRRSADDAFRDGLLDAVHASLVHVGVPVADRFQRVLEVADADLRADPTYPDLATPRGSGFAMIEILWSVGRSVKVKRQWLTHFVALLADTGIDADQVLVVFKETQWENWSFGGGRILHV